MRGIWGTIGLVASLGIVGCDNRAAQPDQKPPLTPEQVENISVPEASPIFVIAVDETVPVWIAEEWPVLAEKLIGQMETWHGPLQAPVVLGLSWAPGQQGQLSVAGDTVRGQMSIRLTGKAWQEESDIARQTWQQNLAHETVHLWQRDKHDTAGETVWMHEGMAELWSGKLLVATGVWSTDQAADRFEHDKDQCASAMREGVLGPLARQGDVRVTYGCGSVIIDAMMQWGGGTEQSYTPLLDVYVSHEKTGDYLREIDDERAFKYALSAFFVKDYTLANPREIMAQLAAADLK